MTLHLDLTTLLFSDAMVVALCCIHFVLNTAFGVADRAGRIWSVAFLCGLVVAGAYIVWGLDHAAWWASACGNAMFTAAAGSLWVGSRVFNGRRPLSLVAIALVVVVAGAAALRRDVPEGWGGTGELFAAVAALAALTGTEILRGKARGNRNGVVFSVLCWAIGAFYALRLVVYLVAGPYSSFFTTWLGTPTATCAFIVLTVLGSVSLSLLRVEVGSDAPVALRLGRSVAALTPAAFAQLASSWLERGAAEGQGLALVDVRLEDVDALTAAFGRGARDHAVTEFSRLVAAASPTACLTRVAEAGHLTILLLAGAGEGPALAERLRRRLADAVPDPLTGTRLTARIGVAETAETGFDLTALETSATSAGESDGE